MGTRSLTKVIETYKDKDNKSKKQNIVCMYRQMDGYPSGHGQELSDFLIGMHITNGIRSMENRKTANGMGCLSAQMISHFKTDVGQIYMLNGESRRDWEDYEYIIEGNATEQLIVRINNYEDKEIFRGTISEFKEFCYA